MKTSVLSSLATALGIIFASHPSHAAIVVVAPTASITGSLTITEDITLTIAVAGNAANLVLDEWLTSDGLLTRRSVSPAFMYSVNSGAIMNGVNSELIDNSAGGFANAITIHDGVLVFHGGLGVAVIIGNLFTLKSGVFSLPPVAGFNPQATQTFTGNVFLTTTNGVRLSGNVLIPEPSSALLGLCGIGFLLPRRASRGKRRGLAQTGGSAH